MSRDFDTIVNRLGTFCTQWDYIEDRFGEKDLLPFSISDTDFECPQPVMAALKKRMDHAVFGYTRWNHEVFKEAITGWYQSRFETTIDPKTVVYSPSVKFTISKLMTILSEVGDHIVVQTPAYDAFYKMIEAHKRILSANELKEIEGQFSVNFEDLEAKLAHPLCKIFLLCHPHNPTGRIWPEQELHKMLVLCKKYDVFLLSDDIHMDLVRIGKKFQPVINFSKQPESLCICSASSKTFNTPGLIGSYAIIPDDKLRERYLVALKEADGLSSASTLGMHALIAAYQTCGDWVDNLNAYLDDNMRLVHDYFNVHHPAVKFSIPEATFLAWIDVKDLGFSMDDLQDALVKVGKVGIMDGRKYGKKSGTFLRLNVGCPRSKLLEGLRRFTKAVDSLERKGG